MKIFINLLIIIVVVATISICTIKPNLHKSVLVYNSDYKLVPNEEIKTETQNIPVMEMPVALKVETVKHESQTVSIPKTQEIVKQIVQKPQIQAKTQTVTNAQHQDIVPSQAKKEIQTKIIQPIQKDVHEEIKQEPKIVQTQSQTKIEPKVLTQQEEEIAWNVWRSNLQNKIMQDVKLPVLPNGVVFRFSFKVDKFGKITNIYTYSDNAAFTPYAIQYIAPVIRSFQGKSILNFPAGSSRTSTEFKGGWRISTSERLSSPQDYNDYEKIIKTNY